MKRVLVANRGEIACRVIRAAHKLGLEAVAVASEADVDGAAARQANHLEVIGPPPASASYLNPKALLDAAKRSGADALHPGYGFLSESPEFAREVMESGLVWVGPDPESIALMGNKANALGAARAASLPTIPGSRSVIRDETELKKVARSVGFPLTLKASAGGGGRGIRIVENEADLVDAWLGARREAKAYFGSEDIYLEKFIHPTRHIEVQVFGDGVRYAHLFERDCSMQRRHQKIVEETLAPGLSRAVREHMCKAAIDLARATGYRGAGTVEFLYDTKTEDFYFIEMNTRIQVEHPITEELLGVDLVSEQLRVADGKPMSFVQQELKPYGHVIEMRINAEDPARNFFPSPGRITKLIWPKGEGIRVETGFEEGSEVPFFYDSMLAKLIVKAKDRPRACRKAVLALEQLKIEGIKTTVGFLASVIASPEFSHADHHTRFIDENLSRLSQTSG